MHERVAALGRRRRLLHHPSRPRRRRARRPPCATATPPGCRPSPSPPTRASCCSCWPRSRAPAASWRSAPSAATAPSGWPAPCPADGRLVTLEYDAAHAEVARRNIARAGLDKIVEVRVGPALESLPQLADENPAPFDLVFIDADKANNPHYVEWALKLTRPGSLIVVDNVVRGGRVTDAGSTDPTCGAPAPPSN